MEELTRRVRSDMLQTVFWVAVSLGFAVLTRTLVLPMLGL